MKNVLITGGSRGIGEACVKRLTKEGYRVAFTYKASRERAEALSSLCNAKAVFCELESEKSIINAVKEAKEYLGTVDVLINNAGISEIKLFSDITSEDWSRMLQVNLTAPYIFIRECLSDMIHKKSGRIINISSMWGECGASCEVHYSAAKAGLIGLTKALSKELGLSNITVNAITPGVIDTDMNAHLSEADKNALIDEIPLSRMGTSFEVAEAVAFLCSDNSSYITGQSIGVNGGTVV